MFPPVILLDPPDGFLVLLVDTGGVLACGLEKHRAPTVESGNLELRRVDLGKLEDGDADADDEEAHDERDDLRRGRGEALEEDDGCDDREEGDCAGASAARGTGGGGRLTDDVVRRCNWREVLAVSMLRCV